MFIVPIPRDIAKERGLKSYFTYVLCSLGQLGNKQVSNRSCSCLLHRERRNVNRKNPKNREREYQLAKEWRKNNPEKVKATKKKCLLKNGHKYSQQNVIRATMWNKNNPERAKEIANRSRHKNKEKRNITIKRWRMNNKDLLKVYELKRRSFKINASTIHTELTSFVIQEANALNRLREECTNFKWHLDHMIPLQGKTVCGLHVWNNFQCIPSKVNFHKLNNLIYTNPHEWLYDIPKFFKIVHKGNIYE